MELVYEVYEEIKKGNSSFFLSQTDYSNIVVSCVTLNERVKLIYSESFRKESYPQKLELTGVYDTASDRMYMIDTYAFNVGYDNPLYRAEFGMIMPIESKTKACRRCIELLFDKWNSEITKEEALAFVESRNFHHDAWLMACGIKSTEDFKGKEIDLSLNDVIEIMSEGNAEKKAKEFYDRDYFVGVKGAMYAASEKAKGYLNDPYVNMYKELAGLNASNVILLIDRNGKHLEEKYSKEVLMRTISNLGSSSIGDNDISEYSFPTRKRGEEVYEELFGPRRERNWQTDKLLISDISEIQYKKKTVWKKEG